jgi:predicted ATPase
MPPVTLNSVKYAERMGHPKEWTLDGLSLGPVNLVVGKNATGKTRTLNIIWTLAKMLVAEPKFRPLNAGYDLLFDSDGQMLRYILHIDNGKVTREEVYVGAEQLLVRGLGGEGQILTKEEGKRIRFKPPENELAVVARRDSLQHPFLEPLHDWAAGVRHYTFGTQLGKDHVSLSMKGAPEADDRDPAQVVGIFRKGLRDFGPKFVQAVERDMIELHYELQGVETLAPESIVLLRGGVATEVLAIGVRERGVSGVVDQSEMSQGMFRALSILIQVNYSQMARRANCILIDDIGEGLDFDRSALLIQLLRRKAQESAFQLIMSTNDQFVMNHVPLEEWSVLQREGSHIRVRNHENSKKAFEYFRFVGLSNFSFFEMDFVNSKETAAHE